MFFRFTLIIFLLLSSTVVVWAEDYINCNTKDYSCFEERKEKLCESKWLPWMQGGKSLGKVEIKYPSFDPTALNNTVDKVMQDSSDQSLVKSLSSIGTFQGFRALEIARLQYRSNMNKIFSCAVAAGRSNQITKLQEIVKAKYPSQSSDIQEKVKKEVDRYNRIKESIPNCDQNSSNEDGNQLIVDRLTQSTMVEYCTYSYYLDYLGANVENDYATMAQIENKVGNPASPRTASTISSAAQDMSSRMKSIQNELNRANDTLPKVLTAYREMERTYITHVLLVIIYDDYLTLRDNLNSYMSALSQLFEKANNAQDVNQ